jgi:predicted secreted Zn-dependent protease
VSRAPGGLQVAVERASYPVVGATADALRAVIQTLGPTRAGRTFAAFTDWEVSWDYSIETGEERLRVSDVGVTVRAVVTVPRWRPPRSATAALVEQWRQYLAAIDLHEQGHVNLAVEAGRCVLARL